MDQENVIETEVRLSEEKQNVKLNLSANVLGTDIPPSDRKNEISSDQPIRCTQELDIDAGVSSNDSYLQLETVALDIQEDTTNIISSNEISNTTIIPQIDLMSGESICQTAASDLLKNSSFSDVNTNNAIEKNSNDISSNNQLFLDSGKVIENTCELQAQDSDFEQPSLTKYFTNVPAESSALIDPLAEDFFNSVSSELSPMMKSVSEVAMFKTDTTIPQIANGEGNPSDANFTIGEGVDVTEDLQEKDKVMTNEIARKSSFAEEQSISRKASAECEDKPNLSKFFVEEKVGEDIEGKAFFDALAGIATTGSAVVLSSFHPANNKNLHTVNNTNPLLPISPPETALNHKEEEYYYDIWIPSDDTQKALANVMQASPGTYFAEKDQLTMPGVIFDEDLDDPIKVFLAEVSPDEVNDREGLTADSVSQDDIGLRQLMSEGYYHAAINLTTRLLTNVGQGPGKGGHPSRNTPYTLQLWFTRIALFMQLRKFSQAEVESEVFNQLDQPDLYYEFYPDTYKGKKGSMVSFSFRVLLAELAQYQGNHQKSLDKLYLILGTVRTILDNLKHGLYDDGITTELSEKVRKAAILLWEERECRVLYSLVNCSVSFKDYVMAVNQMHILLQKDKDHQPQLYSAFGRLYLQLGDVKAAQECFSQATFLRTSLPKEVTYEVEELIDKAMMAIAQNAYADAYNYYKQAYSLQSNKPMLLNNMAICLLYMGKLKESLALLEKTVQGNPPMCLHDGIIFNICTLYELESSQSSTRKQNMLHLVAKHAPDNFNTWCLKMQQAR